MLICHEFTLESHSDVKEFNCGDEEWSTEVNRYIVGENGDSFALKHLRSGRAKIWLYRKQEDGKLVGFGSLTTPKWVIDNVDTKLTVLHGLGINREFQGVRLADDGEHTCATRILHDLLEKARGNNRPYCGLLVHKVPRRTAAQASERQWLFPCAPIRRRRSIAQVTALLLSLDRQ